MARRNFIPVDPKLLGFKYVHSAPGAGGSGTA